MFSNGSEADHWQEHNCYHCWKYQPEEIESGKIRCKTAYAIEMGYISGRLSKRVDKITQALDCPCRQEKRPIYKKHNIPMPLFEGILK